MELCRQGQHSTRSPSGTSPIAQVIRRFRDLDMPLEEIHAVLAAPDVVARNTLIAAHLDRLETSLSRTQTAITSLRNLLEQPSPALPADIRYRSLDAAPAAAISEVVDIEDALSWYQGALGELYATLAAQDVLVAGPAGGIFASDLFSHERDQATIFMPCVGTIRAMGRVTELVIPPAELATIVYEGEHADIDRAYGALATHVAHHALAVEGPIREYYLVGRHETDEETEWRTEIGWPIFHTGTTSTA